MALPTPSEFADKWSRRLKGAVEDIRKGVERVTESPGKKAAEKFDKWVAKITAEETQKKWKENVSKVDVGEWKEMMINKGVPAISRGVDMAKSKVEDFASQLLAHIEAGLKKIEAMPDLTLEDSIARATEWIRHMAKFKKK